MVLRSEAAYQTRLIRELKLMFPGCFVMKQDSGAIQGLPDLLILFGTHWAMLEVKLSEKAPFQPNQLYYIELFNEMAFCAVIYPANEEEVLGELQHAFGIKW